MIDYGKKKVSLENIFHAAQFLSVYNFSLENFTIICTHVFEEEKKSLVYAFLIFLCDKSNVEIKNH